MRPDTESETHTPLTLLDILSNSLVLRHTAPYLSTAALFALAATSKSFHSLIHSTPDGVRYLDLSTVRSASVQYVPIDSGGISWRSERMDEAFTEDEFYSGPLRGIFSKLNKQGLLAYVQTLVLDGLSVPADLVREIVSEDRFNVRTLSVREAKNLNERKLTQLLKYAVRPTRPAGTPKLKAMYVFGPRYQHSADANGGSKSSGRGPKTALSVTSAQGAQLGAELNQLSRLTLSSELAPTEDRWYQSSGRMLGRTPISEWAETLQACEGIISFDAVLCRGPCHDASSFGPDSALPAAAYLPPTVATVALGPTGCASCGASPEGPARFGTSPASHLPLLAPPPLFSSSLRAAQVPSSALPASTPPPALFVRCVECLAGRWCERCNIWWCETCYPEARSPDGSRTTLQRIELAQEVAGNGQRSDKPRLKVGAVRDCFGCGRTCADCKSRYIRVCQRCRNEYCLEDNEGCSPTACDWCHRTGRRTRIPY